MNLIKPFRGIRPNALYQSQTIAPPYDVISSAAAKQFSKNKPYNFLHISKPEIDLAENTNPYVDEVYQQGAKTWQKLLADGILQQDSSDCYYLYRLTTASHQQLGLVAAVSVAAYQQAKVRRHELTRPDKELDRVKHIKALNAQISPVLLAHRYAKTIEQLLLPMSKTNPSALATAEDGVKHELWLIQDNALIKEISNAFNALDTLYIADGHHRSAAAATVANNDYFLSVIFPDNQLEILGYHRVIKDLNGLSTTDFINKLAVSFAVKKSNKVFKPQHKGQIGMYLDGCWYELTIKPALIPSNNPLHALDVELFSAYILEPLLGIKDQRRDPRIDFVGGIHSFNELEQRIHNKKAVVAFALFPTTMQELLTIADAHLIMPPKSTWFEPKLADGLICYGYN